MSYRNSNGLNLASSARQFEVGDCDNTFAQNLVNQKRTDWQNKYNLAYTSNYRLAKRLLKPVYGKVAEDKLRKLMEILSHVGR